ncbi:hypothetical protein SEA_SATIS_131 [Streptomyces phage Satis]|nr:hypothetical protein SEA_SATIS_131 [Streptomyces phage Satis]QBZ72029.1 hypothetical protein SEA_KRADAL_131 [Streptomyces phage Kradal]QPL14449.1 membrane protein [Streptomyces phage EhyElimayoE]
MKKQVIQDPDDHLVLHDAACVGIAGVLGAAGAIVTGSPEVGLMATGVMAATGIGSMNIGPVRRGVNRVAMALAGGEEVQVDAQADQGSRLPG